jgi:hypothetical protein
MITPIDIFLGWALYGALLMIVIPIFNRLERKRREEEENN